MGVGVKEFVLVAVGVGVGVAQGLNGDALLRGVGGAFVKSAELLSVSVQPFPFLIAALLLSKLLVGFVSEQFAVVP